MRYNEIDNKPENIDKYSRREVKKPSTYLNYYDDINVISRQKFDDNYNSFNFTRDDELLDEEDDRFDNYRELNRYDSIVSFIDEDKSHMQNYDNFQKNNVAFYNSIKDQIFSETHRILSTDNKNNLDINSLNDLARLEKKYSTNIQDVDKIIAIASEKDKKLLNLIINNDEEAEILKKKASTNSETTNNIEDENLNDHNINDVPSQPMNDLEEINHLDKTKVESQPKEAPEIPKATQSVDTELPKSPRKEYPNPILVDDSFIKSSNDNETLIRPKKVIEETEYAKINNMINEYHNEKKLNTYINKNTKPISISDALYVNLQEKFYINENDLTRQRNNQNKVINDALSDYKNTFNENVWYEAKKEIQNIKENSKSAFNYQNLNTTVSNENAKNVAILNENNELKEKIKLLEEEVKKNVNDQRELDSKKSDLELQIEKTEKEIKDANAKKVETKFKAIPTTKASTPNLKNYAHTFKTINIKNNEIDSNINNQINQQTILSEANTNNDNNLMIINNTNNEKVSNYNIPQTAKNPTLVNNLLIDNRNNLNSLKAVKKNKPFTYYETDNNNFLNNKINFTSEINSIKNQNVLSLQNAINSKKQELFQSFNNPNMLDSNTTVASKIIFNNKFSDVHNQEQKVSLKEAMNINKKRELF